MRPTATRFSPRGTSTAGPAATLKEDQRKNRNRPIRRKDETTMLKTIFVSDDEKNTDSNRLGWFCIQDDWPMQNEPIKVIQYWPLRRGQRFHFEELIGITDIIYNRYAHSYSIRTGDYRWEKFYLPDGGKTVSLKVEEEEIPPPKTRVKTRYYFGRWERYLKNKGCVC